LSWRFWHFWVSPALVVISIQGIVTESSRKKRTLTKRKEAMKMRKVVGNSGSTAKVVSQPETTKNAPTPEEIRQRAFEIHIERGGIHGCDLDDWLQAERELQEKYKNGGLSEKK
jgi:hypothetical protein